MTAVFRRAHHDDDVGGAGFVARALTPDPYRERNEISKRKHEQNQRRQTSHALEVRYSYVNIVCAAAAYDADRTGYERGESSGEGRAAGHRARRPDRGGLVRCRELPFAGRGP